MNVTEGKNEREREKTFSLEWERESTHLCKERERKKALIYQREREREGTHLSQKKREKEGES